MEPKVKQQYSMGTHLLLLQKVLDSLEKYEKALWKTKNTAYPHDAKVVADKAKFELDFAIQEAKKYGGHNA